MASNSIGSLEEKNEVPSSIYSPQPLPGPSFWSDPNDFKDLIHNPVLSSSVFDSPDKNSINEIVKLSFNNLNESGKNWSNFPLTPVENEAPVSPPLHPQEETPIMPPVAPKIEQNLPKELQILLQLGYPYDEALTALYLKNMELNQAIEFLNQRQKVKLEQVKQQQQIDQPKPIQNPVVGSTTPVKPQFSFRFVYFLFQIKKCVLDGFLDVELLNQFISPLSFADIYQVVLLAERLNVLKKTILENPGQTNMDQVNMLKQQIAKIRVKIEEEQTRYMSWRLRSTTTK